MLGRDNLAILRLINTFNVYSANIKVSKRLKAYVNHHYGPLRVIERESPVFPEITVQSLDPPIIYTPYIPTVRRIYPELISHDIVAVQPMNNGPVGFAAALRHQYGEGANTGGGSITYPQSIETGNYVVVASC